MGNDNSLNVLQRSTDTEINAGRNKQLAVYVHYRQKWRELMQSRLFLAFIISFIIWAVYIGEQVVHAIWNAQRLVSAISTTILLGSTQAMSPGLLESAQTSNSRAFLWVAGGLILCIMILLVAALWVMREEVRSVEKNKSRGISVLFSFFVAVLALMIAAFFITLPLCVDWLPTDPLGNKGHLIVYAIYVFIGVDCGFAVAVMKRIQDNLATYERKPGPVIGWVVMTILRSLAVVGFELWSNLTDAGSIIAAAKFVLPSVLLIVLLFRYRHMVLNMDK